AEFALRRSEERYRTLFEDAPIGIGISDSDGKIYDANLTMEQLIGYSRDELRRINVAETYADEKDREIVLRALQKDDRARDVETILKRRDGSKYHALLNVDKIELDDQNVYLTTIRDITERKEAESALQQSEEKYRSLFANSLDGIIIHDLSGKIIDANQKALALFGYSVAEMLLLKIPDLHPSSSLGQSKKAFEAIGKEGTVRFEIGFKKNNGTLFSAEVSSSLFEIGGQKVVQGIIRDITDRKESSEEFRHRSEQLAEAQQLAHLGSWEWDISQNTTVWSDELFQIFGVNPDYFDPNAYEAFLDCLHPEDRDRVVKVMQQALNDLLPFNVEYRIIRPNKTVRHIHARGKITCDETGRPTKMLGTSQDITERKKMTDELSEFVHAMAHDINGKLAVISGFAELIEANSDPTLAKKISRIVRTLSDLLVRSVALADAGQAIGEMIDVDLNSLVEEVSLNFIPSTIAFEMDKLPRVKGDREKITQAFLNLFENALTHGTPKKIEVRQQESEGESQILIINDGTVISPEHRERIFQRGFTTKAEGRSGLGLAIVQKIINAHNWKIGLMETEKTTFCITIPATSLLT
ncbi:MAG: PAS domain S-box protein, partial [Candidatus Hodarchaeales archaeon]